MGLESPLWREFVAGIPNAAEASQIVVRLSLAVLFGGILGLERGQEKKAAGMRTHMLVALGCALAMMLPQSGGMLGPEISRVIQGALAGIGFLGGGVILKLSQEHQIVGVTTAANIWLTATVGMATGLGRLGLAAMGTALAFIILTLFARLEHWLNAK